MAAQPHDTLWLLAGLGNPGAAYAQNRHNIGFHQIQALASYYHSGPFRKKFDALLAAGEIGAGRALLLMPQTYMNNSGQSVAKAAKFHKIAPARIVVFHDELDLAPGKIRVKYGGGTAGHNGLKSIAAHLGTPDFWRVRMGIGHPGDKARVHNYVLSDIPKAEQEMWDSRTGAVARHVALILDGRPELFMTKVAEDTLL